MRTPQAPGDDLSRARDLLALSATDPERARALAGALLERRGTPPAVRVVAATAAGQSALYLGHVADATRLLTRAVRTARPAVTAAGGGVEPADLGRALLARGPLLLELGRPAAAARTLDEAAQLLSADDDLLRLSAYRAHLAYVRGRMDECVLRWDELVDRLAATGTASERWATALHNRALALTRMRRDAEARRDLQQAAAMFAELGVDDGVASAQTHLGWIAARDGDVAEALRRFSEGAATVDGADGGDLGEDDARLLSDLSAALLAARLLPEAADAGARAAAALAAAGARAASAEAALHAAEARLGMGDVDRVAEEVTALLRRRPGPGPSSAAMARFLRLRADVARASAVGRTTGPTTGERTAPDAAGDPRPALLTRARAAVGDLTAAGWPAEALAARLVAARLAADLGRTATARALLAVDPRARHRGPVQVRCAAWHAQALLCLADGDRARAARAVRSGLGVLDAQRVGLGAGELRASVSGHGADLARLGVRLAVEDGDAAAVLRASERWRAAAVRSPAARPPADAELAADLARLREASSQLRAAAVAGTDTARLRSRVATLETAVRRRSRLVPAAAGAARLPGLDVAGLRRRLGDVVLVEFVADGDRLLAVTLSGRARPRLDDVGSLAAAVHEAGSLAFALRLIAGAGPAAMAAKAQALARDAAARLDAQLFGRPSAAGEATGLVVVPTAGLHAVPWSLLPTCAGRALTSVPSAALWHRAADRAQDRAADSAAGPGHGGSVLVAGPGLRHADAEVAAIAAQTPGATVLTGGAARADDVLAAMDGARMAHLATHGSFRADNPLFSSLRLADGPLTVHDLQRLRQAPGLTVLSACDVGLSDVRAGDEVLGVVAALLGLGGASLVASVVPVRDAAVATLMTALHDHLRVGASPSAALAAARAGLDDDAAMATAGMTCFGLG